jgi:hypothetical protein
MLIIPPRAPLRLNGAGLLNQIASISGDLVPPPLKTHRVLLGDGQVDRSSKI